MTRAKPDGRAREALRWFLAIAFAFAGYKHLSTPAGFLAITPSWVPAPELVIRATGWCELAGALGLMTPPSMLRWARPAAGIGLALYSLCVWPANLHHALADIPIGGVHLSWWYHGPRLAAQPLIMWAALWASGVVDWPFRRKTCARPNASQGNDL